MDLVAEVERSPRPGETVWGRELRLAPGGKGGNQAVAAARLGGRVTMLGRVGADSFGECLLGHLRRAGVDTAGVRVTPGVTTGTAIITVEETAENRIIILPGANGRCSRDDVLEWQPVLQKPRYLLVQLELPFEVVEEAVRIAHAAGVRVLLDPAPARPLSPALLEKVDLLLPNAREAAALTGREVDDPRGARLAGVALLEQGVKRVVVKLGRQGAVLVEEHASRHFPAYPAPAVDTTGAGDAFAGALAVALNEGKGLEVAISFANAAGALAVTRPGAQEAMPWRRELEAFLKRGAGVCPT